MHVKHRTKHLKINVVLPSSRPPRHCVLIEGNRQRSHDLGEGTQVLPDGRWRVSSETHRPRLYENYVLQWAWHESQRRQVHGSCRLPSVYVPLPPITTAPLPEVDGAVVSFPSDHPSTGSIRTRMRPSLTLKIAPWFKAV